MKGEIKVLIIDDSAYNRQTITSMLESQPGIRVVARAGDGDEGLKQVFAHQPDVVTLDLEMPRMDGFTFLRILMSRRPTPVIVISSYARRENVFKALELGALDFIAKPTQKVSPELREIESELVEKVKLVTKLRVVPMSARSAPPDRMARPAVPEALRAQEEAIPERPVRLVVMGASTGGPPALTQVMTALPARVPTAVVIAQHMPIKFTQAFAERLDRTSALEVREAEHGEVLRSGLALVAPGAGVTTLVRAPDGTVRIKLEAPSPEDRFVPSIDRLFETAAEAMGSNVLGVILTGMAGDAGRGARAIKERGGRVIVESVETAVIFGMPEEAIRAAEVDEILPLGQIGLAVARFMGG